MEKTVTIACPVRNREQYLPFYLDSIFKQTFPKELTNLFFVTNNCTDDSKKILKKFKQTHEHLYPHIRIDNIDNDAIPDDTESRYIRSKTNSIYVFLAELRNYIAFNTNTDFLFSCDSDIMLLPETLERLLNHNKKLVSALVCNGHVFAQFYKDLKINKYKYTNCMKRNISSKYVHFLRSELKGLIEVDVTGAVYLIHKDIYKNCKYEVDQQGEDIPFCESVQESGEKLYCDTDLKLPHCMTLDLLADYKKGIFKY